MNRLYHLKHTLHKNIEDNKDYSNVEFVLLNYNSQDSLEEWVKNTMMEYIEKGTLVYVKTNEPKYFHRSHSRNVAFRVASGKVLCNIDADNYTGKGFASFINQQFNTHNNFFLTSNRKKNTPDKNGKVCVKAEDFYKVRGYDEVMSDWGFEDFDFYTRLNMIGLKEKHINQHIFLRSIPHGHSERVKNELWYNKVKHVYIRYISPEASEVVLLYKDNEFERGTLITDHEKQGAMGSIGTILTLKEKQWMKGKWASNTDYLYLDYHDMLSESLYYIKNPENACLCLIKNERLYYLIEDPKVLEQLMIRRSEIINFKRHRLHIENNDPIGNHCSFGVAKLQRNFNEYIQIR